MPKITQANTARLFKSKQQFDPYVWPQSAENIEARADPNVDTVR